MSVWRIYRPTLTGPPNDLIFVGRLNADTPKAAAEKSGATSGEVIVVAELSLTRFEVERKMVLDYVQKAAV